MVLLDSFKQRLFISTSVIDKLFDDSGNAVEIKKEGIHFDLEHRNRIKWRQDEEGLEQVRIDLENRIKAIIV